MADKIGAIEIEVSASPDVRKIEGSAKTNGEKWVKTFIASVNNGIDKASSTTFGKNLFGNRTYNIQNQPTGYQGGILSGAANSVNSGVLLKLGLIAGGIGLVVGMMAKYSPALQGQFRILETALKLFFRPFGDFLAQLLRPAMQWLLKVAILWNKYLQPLVSAGNKSGGNGFPTGNSPEDIITTMAKIFKEILNPAQALYDALTVLMPKIYNLVGDAFRKLAEYLPEPLKAIANAVGNTFSGLASFLSNISGNIYSFVTSAWSGISNFMAQMLANIVTNYVNTWTGIFDFLSNILGGIYSAVTGIWSSISSFLSGILGGIYNTIIGVWGNIQQGVYNILIAISTNIVNILTGVYNWIGNIWAGVSNAIGIPLMNVINWANNIWAGVTSAILAPLINAYNWIAAHSGGLIQPTSSSGSSSSPSGGGGTIYPEPYYTASSGGVTVTGNAPVTADPNSGSSPDDIPIAFAEGGVVTGPTYGLVGEAGPEAIIPLSKLGKGGNNTTININVQYTDNKKIIEEVTRKLSIELQRRASVYG